MTKKVNQAENTQTSRSISDTVDSIDKFRKELHSIEEQIETISSVTRKTEQDLRDTQQAIEKQYNYQQQQQQQQQSTEKDMQQKLEGLSSEISRGISTMLQQQLNDISKHITGIENFYNDLKSRVESIETYQMDENTGFTKIATVMENMSQQFVSKHTCLYVGLCVCVLFCLVCMIDMMLNRAN